MREDSGSTVGTVIFSFFLGGLVGAGVALLLAPKSGTETRQKIKELAEEVKGKAEGYYDTAKGKAEGYYETARGKAEGYYETAREKASGTIEKGKDFVEKKKGLVTTAIEAGVEAYEREKGKLSESQ